MSDKISTETNCPTCGSAVKVGGDGETHYYIPITAPCEVVLRELYQRLEENERARLTNSNYLLGAELKKEQFNLLCTIAGHAKALLDSRQPSGSGWLPSTITPDNARPVLCAQESFTGVRPRRVIGQYLDGRWSHAGSDQPLRDVILWTELTPLPQHPQEVNNGLP
jgi:hypothetical protein